MLFFTLYTLFLHLVAIAYFPYFLYARLRYGKYKESFSQRLGFNFPKIEKGERFLVWVHAVSFGETRAVAPLVRLIKKERPNSLIVISSITETGHKEALEIVPKADFHVYLPFDLPYVIRPIINQAKPNLVLITETDFWYHFQSAAKECGADIVVVNGKLSERSLKRYSFLPWLTAPIFHSLDFLCVQSEAYQRRFLELGIPPDHLAVSGNLKLDDTYKELTSDELSALQKKLGIDREDKLLVIGSSHDPEEKLILSELKKVWRRWPNLKVLLVPRHPERFKGVGALLEKQEIPFALWSREEKLETDRRVMLVDAMGMLRQLYQLADIALVAGSFTDKVGGHNLVEPSWYGKPVVYGPHIYSQKDFDALIEQKQAGVCIKEDEIADTLLRMLANPTLCDQMGLAGKKIFSEAKGATQKTWDSIQKIF